MSDRSRLSGASPAPREQPSDLGFGTVVANQSRERLLNPDGTFNVRRKGLPLVETLSMYHELLSMRWSTLVTLIALAYVAINLLFAMAFFLCGPTALTGLDGLADGERFVKCFFFSVHTLATIGYGNVAPRGLAADLVVTLEALVGLLGIALVTGVIFAKFARPRAELIFSRQAVIAPYRDGSAFMFRIANRKKTQLVGLESKIVMTRWKEGQEGRSREFMTLTLERDRVTFFPLTWTIVHPIDETSPLWNMNFDDLRRADPEFLILLTGFDDTFAQTVHARSSYKLHEIVWGARFKSVFNELGDDGKVSVDLSEIHDIEPAPLPSPPMNA